MPRPHINHSVGQLEADLERALRSGDSKTLDALAYELTFRKTPRARELRETITALSQGSVHQNASVPRRETQRRTARKAITPPLTVQQETRQGQRRSNPSKLKPTDEQAAAIEFFLTGGSLKINAYAGTGKTSTLVMLADSTAKRGQYVAFNRDIVRDAKEKFPNTVHCSTIHGLAFRATSSKYSECTPTCRTLEPEEMED